MGLAPNVVARLSSATGASKEKEKGNGKELGSGNFYFLRDSWVNGPIASNKQDASFDGASNPAPIPEVDSRNPIA